MDWNKLDKIIVESDGHKFFRKHERLIIFIQGIIVIGLLCGIIMFFMQDRVIKEQIRDHCGYTTDKYECVCEQDFVSNWKDLKYNNNFTLNITDIDDV